MRAFDWPGKIKSDEQLKSTSPNTAKELPHLNQYGGWDDGPKLQATGYFRVAQHNGRWWLIDPEGRLFWSHGINGVGRPVLAQVTWKRPLFSWSSAG